MSNAKEPSESPSKVKTGDSTSIPWERVTSLLGVVSGLSLFLSIVFDMGYFDTTGLRFADVPTTIADHVRSALLWAPQAVAAAFAYIMIDLMQKRFGGMLADDGISLSQKQIQLASTLRKLAYRGIIFLAFLIVWADALTGGQFAKYAAAATTIVIGYIVFSSVTHTASKISLSPSTLVLLCAFPVVTSLVYNTGVSRAIEERSEPRKAAITLDGQREVQLTVYRYLDRGILAAAGEGQLVFYRWEEIKRLTSTFQPPKRVNWLCQAIDVGCTSSARPPGKPASGHRP
jgi:hypothetical protein